MLQAWPWDFDDVEQHSMTRSFCHADWQHLSGNLFLLYIFGRSVEDDEGGLAVWITYLVCALGAPNAFLCLPPHVTLIAAQE